MQDELDVTSDLEVIFRSAEDLRIFSCETKASISIISRAIIRRERGTWLKEAAKIKENCIPLGLDRIAEICGQIEEAGNSEHFQEIEIQFGRLLRELERFIDRQVRPKEDFENQT